VKGSSDERWQRLLRGDDLPQFAQRKLALRDISTVPPSAAKNLKRRDSAHHHSGRSRLHRRVVPRVPRNTEVDRIFEIRADNALVIIDGATPGWSAILKLLPNPSPKGTPKEEIDLTKSQVRMGKGCGL
jgi:hypothetical protein